MSKYSMVQTGPKTQFGGEKEGLLRSAYQVGIEAMVNGVAKIPANSQMIIASTSFRNTFTSLV